MNVGAIYYNWLVDGLFLFCIGRFSSNWWRYRLFNRCTYWSFPGNPTFSWETCLAVVNFDAGHSLTSHPMDMEIININFDNGCMSFVKRSTVLTSCCDNVFFAKLFKETNIKHIKWYYLVVFRIVSLAIGLHVCGWGQVKVMKICTVPDGATDTLKLIWKDCM